MARIRSVHFELRTSESCATWPREVRYAWVMLWGYLDDYGRGMDNPRIVAADCFPLDDDVTPDVMADWLDTFEKAGSICRYTAEDKRYLHAVHWSEYQKPQHPAKPRIPPCPLHEPDAHMAWLEARTMTLTNLSGDSHEDLLRPSPTKGRGSSRRSKEGEGLPPAPAPPYPAHCPKHAHTALPGRCGDCKDARVAYETRQAIALAPKPKPPWCGVCEQTTRQRETDFGVIRCPECHPLAAEA